MVSMEDQYTFPSMFEINPVVYHKKRDRSGFLSYIVI